MVCDQDLSSSTRVRVDFPSRDKTSSFADSDMTPPRHQFLGVLETAGTDIQSFQHWLLCCVLVLFGNFPARILAGLLAARAVPGISRGIAQHFLPIIAGIPCPEAQISQHNLINVAVCSGRPSVVDGQSGRLRRRDWCYYWRCWTAIQSGWHCRGTMRPQQGRLDSSRKRRLRHMVCDLGSDEIRRADISLGGYARHTRDGHR